jgi:hypothetical protein
MKQGAGSRRRHTVERLWAGQGQPDPESTTLRKEGQSRNQDGKEPRAAWAGTRSCNQQEKQVGPEQKPRLLMIGTSEKKKEERKNGSMETIMEVSQRILQNYHLIQGSLQSKHSGAWQDRAPVEAELLTLPKDGSNPSVHWQMNA